MREILWVTPGDLSKLRRTILSETAPIFNALTNIVGQNRRTHALLRILGEKMGAFEDSMAELAVELDDITNGWAEKLEASEATTAALREQLAAAGRPDSEVVIEESARQSAVVQALIVKLRDAGKNDEAPIDVTPLPDVEDVEPVPTPDVTGDTSASTGDAVTGVVSPADEVPAADVPESDDVPDDAPSGTTPDFTPDPAESPAVDFSFPTDADAAPGTPLTDLDTTSAGTQDLPASDDDESDEFDEDDTDESDAEAGQRF